MVDTAMIRLSVTALPDNRIRFAFFEALPPTAATIADESVRLFGERLHLAPQDILFAFYEVEPNLPALSCYVDQARSDRGCLSRDIGNLRKSASP
jgi:hypothetical protein